MFAYKLNINIKLMKTRTVRVKTDGELFVNVTMIQQIFMITKASK